MAGEITLSVVVSAERGGAVLSSASASAAQEMIGMHYLLGTQEIGTAAELLDFGDLAGAPGLLLVVNLDASNYIELSLDESMTDKICKLRAGSFCLFEPGVATIYAKANGSSVSVQVFALEA